MRIKKFWRQGVAGFDPWRSPGEATFHPDVAERVIEFFPRFVVHDKDELAGKPFELLDWQKLYVGHLFAWKYPDGFRRFRRSLLYIPRKNGKSHLAAGLALLMLVGDAEFGAEVYCVAAEKEQASIVFGKARLCVESNAALSGMMKPYAYLRSIEYVEKHGVLRVLSSDAETKHGYNPSGYIIDEVHAQKKHDLMRVMETGTAARRQPLGLYLTTADFDRPSPCNELAQYARDVRDGTIDDEQFFPVIFEATKDDDWHSEAVWKKANPNYGISLRPEYMRSMYKQALALKSIEVEFRRLHLNQVVSSQNAWLSLDAWRNLGRVTAAELAGLECFGALDLSSTRDITAAGLFFPERRAFLFRFWAPKKTAEQRREYQIWAEQGWIEITEGKTVNYDHIRDWVVSAAKTYKLLAVAYDPWNGQELCPKLADEDGLLMIEFRQGFASMNAPAKEFERAIIEGSFNHEGSPVMDWMISNVEVQTDKSSNIKPVKPGLTSPQKVDGVVTGVMALGLSMSPPDELKKDETPYKSRGMWDLAKLAERKEA